MASPIIHSMTGAVLSAEEIMFAHQVAASFSLDMNRGWIKVVKRVDPVTGAVVEYHSDKNLAYVTPGGVTDYVTTTMPNPVPYRGVSIGVVTGATIYTYSSASFPQCGSFSTPEALAACAINHISGIGTPVVLVSVSSTQMNFTAPLASPSYSIQPVGSSDPSNPTKTYVMASDGEVLASEVQNIVDGFTRYVPDSWRGGNKTWMSEVKYDYVFNHYLSFVAPEDCVYPKPSFFDDINTMYASYPTNDNGIWEYIIEGISAFKLRRLNWFKKNSDEFIAAAKTGFAPGATGVTRAELQTGRLPESWDYQIKTKCRTSFKTYQPILMNVTYVDMVMSDTSSSLNQAGTMVTKRTVTFNYVDAAGVFQQKVIDGYATAQVTAHVSQTYGTYLSQLWTYDSWFTPYGQTETHPQAYAWPQYQFLTDHILDSRHSPVYGLVWSGIDVVQEYYTYRKDSAYYDTPVYSPEYSTFTPPLLPKYNTLVGTAPDFILTYHNTVLPKYHKETPIDVYDGSSDWNNSAMHGVTEVHVTPVGMIADFTTNISKSGTLNGYPGNNGHLKAGTYYGRVFALSNDGTEFVKCSAVKKVVTTNADTEAGEGTNSILWQWTKMTYVDTDGVTKDVETYYQHVWSVPDGIGTWYHPGGALSGTQNDMTMGYPHPFTVFDANKVGIFHGVSGTMDGNRLRIYGTAIYKFDWNTGALTFKAWKPLMTDGVEVTHKDVQMAGAQVWSDGQINCVVTYKGLHWPDVITAIKARDKDMSSGTFVYSDPTLNELVKAIKAG